MIRKALTTSRAVLGLAAILGVALILTVPSSAQERANIEDTGIEEAVIEESGIEQVEETAADGLAIAQFDSPVREGVGETSLTQEPETDEPVFPTEVSPDPDTPIVGVADSAETEEERVLGDFGLLRHRCNDSLRAVGLC